jgi:NitT/TauT family transport system substrate-binding protein
MRPLVRRRLVPVSLALAGALTLAACGSSSNSGSSSGTTSGPVVTTFTGQYAHTGANTPPPKPLATPTNVTVGVTAKIEVFGEPQVALVQGEFKKENLNVTVQVAPANSVPQLLAQGQMQVVLNGLNAGNFNAASSGVSNPYLGDPYAYAPGDPTGLWVNKKFLNSDGSLKKPLPSNFSVSLGQAGIAAPSIIQTEQWLEKYGYTYNNVKNVSLAQPDIVTALQNGSLDAGYANTPFANALVNNPSFEKVTGTALAVGAFQTSSSYLNQHRDVVAAVLRALVRTARTYFGPGYRSNAQVMNIISQWIGAPVSTLTQSTPVIFSQDLSMAPLLGPIQQMQSIYIKLGGVLQYSKPIPNSQLVNTSVLANVLNGQ